MTWGDPAATTEVGDWLTRGLFDKRIVQLVGSLDDRAAGEIVAQLMTLDALGDDPVEFRITSPGGTVAAALAVIDVVGLVGVPVHAFATGRVHGPAVGVLAVSDRRAVADHTSLRLVEPEVEFRGSATQLGGQAAAHREEWGAFCTCVARAVHRSVGEVASDAAAGRFLTAEEAVDYGIADEVARRTADIHRLPGRPIGFRPDGAT
jgi:ATP-dependent Clp protease protease subunit